MEERREGSVGVDRIEIGHKWTDQVEGDGERLREEQ